MSKAKINFGFFALLTTIIWFFLGFYSGEDSLGGAKHDYLYHEKYLFQFSNELLNTLSEYGNNSEVRNSPVFYIIFSLIYRIEHGLEFFKYVNLFTIILLIYLFNKCLSLKFIDLSSQSRFFLISCILLSPTIRSLANYPYPLLYGLSFFLISIFFFIKFRKNKNLKLLNASFCILNLSIASYFTPNFSAFIIFYFYHFFLKFNNLRSILYLIFFSLCLSVPALFFVMWKNFYLFKNTVTEISIYEKINIFNKVIIIFSFLIFFFIPFMKKNNFYFNNIKKKISKNLIIIFIFLLTCFFFYDYRPNIGGGIFVKLSYIFFQNNFIIFSVFFFAVIFFNLNNFINLNNVIIIIVLILYNLQYSIYYKYFDPLLFFIFLFLFKFYSKEKLDLNKISKKYFIFYIFFLIMNIYKAKIIKILFI
ncbi:hypothetical protein OAP45_00175 [Candidatus Pelagibacter sp.]|nr:hypothetical protein [Candidatus Pelagibacter sp.]